MIELFDGLPAPQETIEQRFEAFRAANPYVEVRLRELALQEKHAGNFCSISFLFDELRRERLATTGKKYVLDNSFASYYARRLMATTSELADYFHIRALHPKTRKILART